MDNRERQWLPLLLVALVAAAPVVAVGCKDKPAENAVDAAPATSSAAALGSAPPVASGSASGSASAAASAGRDRRRGPRGGGPSGMLFHASTSLADLKDEQKAKIEAAEKQAQSGADPASREAMRTAAKDLHTDLVAGVKAGKVEAAKLEPRYAAIEKIMKVQHDKEGEALNALHAALDPAQRKAAVADVRAKQAAREERMAKHDKDGKDDKKDGDKAKDGKDDKKDGAGDGSGSGGGGGAGKHRGGKSRVERLTHDLELDAEQQKKVAALAPKEDAKKAGEREAAKKKMEALLTAFEKDTFDAKKIEAFDTKVVRAPMEEEAKLLGQILPILKPEQREKLASKMEKGPSPHGRRGGGGFDRRPVEQDDDGDDD